MIDWLLSTSYIWFCVLVSVGLFFIRSDKTAKRVTLFATVILLTGCVLFRWWAHLDRLSVIMVCVTVGSFSWVTLFTHRFSIARYSRFFAWIFLLEASLLGLFATEYLWGFYLFWECSLIPVLLLMMGWGDQNTNKNTFRFLMVTISGSILLLASLIFLSVQIPLPLSMMTFAGLTILYLPVGIQLILAGLLVIPFLIKMPIFPFHSWQIPLYESAPLPLLLLLAAVMSKMGLYGLFRFLPIMAEGLHVFRYGFLALALTGVFYASWLALRQPNPIRLLAFSSVAHLSFYVAGFFTFNACGWYGSVFQLIGHSVCVLGLLGVIALIQVRTGAKKWDQISGLKEQHPLLNTLFFCIVLGSIAFPLTGGFIGEIFILKGLAQVQILMAVLGGSTLVFGAWYMLRLVRQISFNPISGTKTMVVYWHELLLIGLLVGATFVMGIFPSCIAIMR